MTMQTTTFDWRTFECEECGAVEDIDVSQSEGEQVCDCGGLMRCIDGVREDK